MTREEFYKLTDILNSEVLGNFMHGGEADELIAMFEEAVEHSNILEQEEPAGEDLPKVRERETLDEYAYQCAYNLSNDWAKENADWHDVEIACKLGAHWQREKMEANRIAHCNNITEEQYNLETGFIDQHIEKNNRMPTFLDAIEYGMKKQREQMMKDAIEVTVHIDAGGYPYIPQMEFYDYDKDAPLAKEWDKYKVILIKKK